jgi:hypothetical protein
MSDSKRTLVTTSLGHVYQHFNNGGIYFNLEREDRIPEDEGDNIYTSLFLTITLSNMGITSSTRTHMFATSAPILEKLALMIREQGLSIDPTYLNPIDAHFKIADNEEYTLKADGEIRPESDYDEIGQCTARDDGDEGDEGTEGTDEFEDGEVPEITHSLESLMLEHNIALTPLEGDIWHAGVYDHGNEAPTRIGTGVTPLAAAKSALGIV